MAKKFIITGVVIILAGLIFWAARTKNGSTDNLNPSNKVTIESIAPAFGPIGTKITVTGTMFSGEDNDIGFAYQSKGSEKFTTGYINHIKSVDGKTLTFDLPEAIGVCAASTVSPDTACIELALILPKQKVELFVVNKFGTSNTIGFVIN